MTSHAEPQAANRLRIRPMGIDTYQDSVIYMRKDCPVCISEGWNSQVRLQVATRGRSIVATLNVVGPELLRGLSGAIPGGVGRMDGAAVAVTGRPAPQVVPGGRGGFPERWRRPS